MALLWAVGCFAAGIAVGAVLGGQAALGALFVSVAFLVFCAVLFPPMRLPAILFFMVVLGALRAQSGAIEIPYVEYVVDPLMHVRDAFAESIARALPEPQASYMAGILVGAKSTIPYDVRDAFRRTGTSHILALSGYNVTIIARSLERVFSSVWITGGVITLFVLATGAASSLVRAALMSAVFLVAKKEKRTYSAVHALAVAVFAMLLFDPSILLGDIGFQLSVLATLGLIYFEKPIGERLRFLSDSFGIRDALASTLAAEAATLPAVLWYFGFFSPFSPIVNMLVLPTVPAAMLAGFLSGVVGFVSTPISIIVAWPAYLITSYQLAVIQFFAHISVF